MHQVIWVLETEQGSFVLNKPPQKLAFIFEEKSNDVLTKRIWLSVAFFMSIHVVRNV